MDTSHNQKRLVDHLPDNTIAVVLANPIQYRNADVAHPYRQNSDFYYLTAAEYTPAAWIVSRSKSGGIERRLFYTPRPLDQQKWVGREAPHDNIASSPLWDELLPYENLLPWLETTINTYDIAYYPDDMIPLLPPETAAGLRKVFAASPEHALRHEKLFTLTSPLRLIKQPYEIAAIKKAGAISADAHRRIMREARAGMTEFDLAALFDYDCLRHGADRMAFLTIVAAGRNATTLHYMPGRVPLKSGELVLVDAGCEWQYYASDITRTFPANARFSPPARDIYEIVLRAYQSCLNIIRPGITIRALQNHAIEHLSAGMRALGIFNASETDIIEQKLYQKFYYHTISHFIGLDVHDTRPAVKEEQYDWAFKPGMTLTIEPGLYFFDDDSPAAYKNIGVRIEDDVLVTADGCEVLTNDAPVTIDDIESLRS